MKKQKEKLRKVFMDALESNSYFTEDLKNINYTSLLCRAGAEGRLTGLLGNNVCGFRCTYEDSSSILIIFAIPITVEDDGAKQIAERVMQIIDLSEQCFITLDYASSREVEEDRFVYVVIVKKIDKYSYLKREQYNEWKKKKMD